MKKIFFSLLALLVILAFADEKTPHFTDYLKPDGSGLSIIKREESSDMTTLDMVDRYEDEIALGKILINQKILEHLSNLSWEQEKLGWQTVNRQKKYWLERHHAWLEYMRTAPSSPVKNQSGSMHSLDILAIIFNRIDSRLKAMELPIEQFKIYEAIANGAQIALPDGNHPMEFGEIVLSLPFQNDEQEFLNSLGHPDKYETYYWFPVKLLPKTCLVFGGTAPWCYSAGIFRWIPDDDDEKVSYYLYIWDPYGNPIASSKISNEYIRNEYDAIESLSLEEGVFRVSFKNNESKHQDFSIEALPQLSASLEVQNIGKKKIHEISATDRLVKDNKVFLQLVKDGVKKGQVPSQMLEETKCSVIFANELYSSYRIEQRINHGVEQRTITVGTIIRDGDTQKTLTLSDIATASQFPHMTTLIWQALMTQLKAMTIEVMRRQLSRNPLPTNNFYYNDKGLHFVYNENEIAPAALGCLDVCIPWPLPIKLHE